MSFFKSISLIFSIIFLITWNSGCQIAKPSTTDRVDKGVLMDVLHLENTDTLPFPIVADFENLAPIFNQHNDTTYVINFWATWCAPCVEEFPYFEQLAVEMKDEAVEIVMVSLDFDRDIRTKLPRFMKERSVSIPVVSLVDPKPNIWIDLVDPEWEGSIPITIVYRNGKRKFIAEEFPAYEDLLNVVKEVRE